MKQILYIVLGSLIAPFSGIFGQEMKINSTGDTIVVFPDGSWKKFEKSDLKLSTNFDTPTTDDPLIITTKSSNIENNDEEKNSSLNHKSTTSTGFLTNRHKVYFPIKQDFEIYPPESRCKFLYNDVDPLTGEKRKLLAQEELLSYTQPQFKHYFKDSDQIKIFAETSSLSGGFHYVRLKVEIKSKSAITDYGNFKVRNAVSFLNIQGEALNLVVIEIASPVYDKTKDLFIFNAQFQISGKQLKKLKKHPIDRMRIVWNTGFEEYEVYNIDFFQRQLDCLN